MCSKYEGGERLDRAKKTKNPKKKGYIWCLAVVLVGRRGMKEDPQGEVFYISFLWNTPCLVKKFFFLGKIGGKLAKIAKERKKKGYTLTHTTPHPPPLLFRSLQIHLSPHPPQPL